MSLPKGIVVTAIPATNLGGGLYSGFSTPDYDFYAMSGAGEALIIHNGEIVWNKGYTYPTMIAGTNDGIVYVGSSEHGYGPGILEAYSYITDTKLWEYQGGVNSHWLRIDNEGNLLFVMTELGFTTTRLIKLDGSTGKEIWNIQPLGENYPFGSDSPVEVSNDSIYLAPSGHNFILKFDPAGSIIWQANNISGTARILEVGNHVYCLRQGEFSDNGSRPGVAISKIDKETGSVTNEWMYSYQDLGFSEALSNGANALDMALDSDGNLILSGILYTHFDAGVGDTQIFLSSLTQDGVVNWSEDFGGEGADGVGARGTSISIQKNGTISVFGTGENTSEIFGAPLESPHNYLVIKFTQDPGIFVGTATRDLIYATDGNDSIQSGSGDDLVLAGSGNDLVNTGTGNDLIIGGNGAGNDNYDGGRGLDSVKFASALAGINVNLEKGTATSSNGADFAGIGTDKLKNIENIIAGDYDDTLIGSRLANSIDGGAGDDTIDGSLGSDTLVGGEGADTFVFSTKLSAKNIDTIDFQAGTDTIKLSAKIFKALTPDADFLTAEKIIYDITTGTLSYDADGS